MHAKKYGGPGEEGETQNITLLMVSTVVRKFRQNT